MSRADRVVPKAGQRNEDESIARLAQRLRERRVELGITQAELADQLGVTQAYLSRLETGEATTQLRRLVRAMSSVGLDLLALPRSHPAAREERLRPVTPPRRARGTDVQHLVEPLNALDPSHIGSPEVAERLRMLQALVHEGGPSTDRSRLRSVAEPLVRLARSPEAMSIAHPTLRRVLMQVADAFQETPAQPQRGPE